MPLDSTTPHTTALAIDLNAPSLPALAYALRHRETWPEGFFWNYCRSDMCAAGLVNKLWNDGPDGGMETARHLVGLRYAEACLVFIGAGFASDTRMWEVTPEMVADVIDAHLVGAETYDAEAWLNRVLP